jgi:hypothetical protein
MGGYRYNVIVMIPGRSRSGRVKIHLKITQRQACEWIGQGAVAFRRRLQFKSIQTWSLGMSAGLEQFP